MSTQKITKKPTRKQVERALAILDYVFGQEDDIAFRLGKDIGHHFKLPVTEGREHSAKFTTLSGVRSERGLAREIVDVTSGVIRELY